MKYLIDRLPAQLVNPMGGNLSQTSFVPVDNPD